MKILKGNKNSCTSIIASLVLIISGFSGWLYIPLKGYIMGYAISLLPYSETYNYMVRFNPLSFGFLVCIIGLLALFLYYPFVRLISGVVVIMAALILIYQIAFLKPELITSFVDFNQQQLNMIEFSKSYLPLNAGVEPTFLSYPAEGDIIETLVATLYFMSWGWYLALIGGVILVFKALSFDRSIGKAVRYMGMSIAILIGSSLFFLFSPLMAEYELYKGDSYSGHGQYEEAYQMYINAVDIYPSLVLTKRYSNRIGALYYQLELTGKPEYHLYKGDLLFKEGKYLDAELEYQIAVKIGQEELKNLARKRFGWFYIRYGLKEYQNKRVNTAIVLWNKAIKMDSNQLQAYYYLGKGYYDISLYEQSIQEDIRFITYSVNPIFNANMYANIGDSYYNLGEYNRAREYYKRSLNLDRYDNYRIIKSLGGT
ncbi:MAG: tetratricopeptide repeat protein [Nitrospirota bacterium]